MTEKEGIGIEEVAAAIAKLKGGRASGVCGINAEMLKGDARCKVFKRILDAIVRHRTES